MSSSSAILSIIAFPITFNFAFIVPGTASNPAWMIALFALDVSLQTSSSFSITHVFNLYLETSLAIALPVTPAPIITTSNISIPLLYHTKKARQIKRLPVVSSTLLKSLVSNIRLFFILTHFSEESILFLYNVKIFSSHLMDKSL